MAINPRTYINNDKKIPASMSGDAGKVLAVNSGETAYEHTGSVTGSPTGTIIMYPTNIPPTGYLVCNGDQYNTAQYPALAAVLGENTPGTFVVPTINFPKNSNGINTLAQEAEGVGPHIHDTDSATSHTHNVSVNSVPNHNHSVRSRRSVGLNTTSGTAISVWEVDEYEVTGSNGAHSHTNQEDYAGAHYHVATYNTSPGYNQPACTLLTFCIKV